jgi:hypothetical protein
MLVGPSGLLIRDHCNQLVFVPATDPHRWWTLEYPAENSDITINLKTSSIETVRYSSGAFFGRFIDSKHVGVVTRMGKTNEQDQHIEAHVWTIDGKNQHSPLKVEVPNRVRMTNNVWLIIYIDTEPRETSRQIVPSFDLEHGHIFCKLYLTENDKCMIQSTAKDMALILIIEDHPDMPRKWKLFKVQYVPDDETQQVKLYAEGIFPIKNPGKEKLVRIDDNTFICQLEPTEELQDLNMNLHSFRTYAEYCVLRYDQDITEITHKNDECVNLTMNIAWCQIFLGDFKVLPDLECILGREDSESWSLFSIQSGECIKTYELDFNYMGLRVLGPLFLFQRRDEYYLVDVIRGEVLYKFPLDTFDNVIGAGMTYLIDANVFPKEGFQIFDYNSFSSQ